MKIHNKNCKHQKSRCKKLSTREYTAIVSLEVDSVEEEVSHDTTNLEFSSQEAVYILMQAVSAFHVSMTLQRCLKPLTSTLRTFSLLLLWQ